MSQVISLALPFFGLIFLGFASGKIAKIPRSGLAWLDFFLVYVALPALFYDIMSKTPIEELAHGSFILATTFSTYAAFALSFAVGSYFGRGDLRIATIQGLVGAYANVGYMGPGLTLAALGAAAAAPTALIFCFDVTLAFTLTPLMMALGGTEEMNLRETIRTVLRRVLLHPFILGTLAGVLAAATDFQLPDGLATMVTFLRNSAAPTALFALGVTVALQPIGRMPVELPLLVGIKLILHPLIAWLMLTWIGGFDPLWIKTAVLMASLPTAATTFVAAQQYDVYVSRAATAIVISTVLSVFTVTGVLTLITLDLLPTAPFGR
ncbi:AEC family transporter [Methylobrevis pamukkalensis]|uniref:Membrane transport protein n=1 Tax=Methylobrevis pamukkalensis TaxID=1439726 RepID=A0A1E3H4M8_9HYPH|nr:AEC family transporter [Methylobrevis pamukkalensis]ODN71279.1 Membrane transport protein [Methylobrevis pamukkalensis]